MSCPNVRFYKNMCKNKNFLKTCIKKMLAKACCGKYGVLEVKFTKKIR